MDNVDENPNEFVPCHRGHLGLSFIPGLQLLDALSHKSVIAKPRRVLWAWIPRLRKCGLSRHPARYELGESFVFGVS